MITSQQIYAIKSWTTTYIALSLLAILGVMLFSKFGLWMLLFFFFVLSSNSTFSNRFKAIESNLLITEFKVSSAISLLAESIKMQSKDLRNIHEWIKNNSFPKTNLKLH